MSLCIIIIHTEVNLPKVFLGHTVSLVLNEAVFVVQISANDSAFVCAVFCLILEMLLFEHNTSPVLKETFAVVQESTNGALLNISLRSSIQGFQVHTLYCCSSTVSAKIFVHVRKTEISSVFTTYHFLLLCHVVLHMRRRALFLPASLKLEVSKITINLVNTKFYHVIKPFIDNLKITIVLKMPPREKKAKSALKEVVTREYTVHLHKYIHGM